MKRALKFAGIFRDTMNKLQQKIGWPPAGYIKPFDTLFK